MAVKWAANVSLYAAMPDVLQHIHGAMLHSNDRLLPNFAVGTTMSWLLPST